MSQDPRKPSDPPTLSRADQEEVPGEVQDAWRAMEAAEPPDLLDQRILNRARAAVNTENDVQPEVMGSKRPWSFGWLHAATTTAVMVLGVTLLLQVRDQAPGSGERPTPSAGAAAPAATQEAAPPDVADRFSAGNTPDARSSRIPSAAPEETLEALNSGTTSAASDIAPITANEPNPITEKEAADPVFHRALQLDQAPVYDAAAEGSPTPDALPTPEAWLEDIRMQAAEGELEAAREALEAFRAAWPDYPIPENLLLAEPHS
ncbi:MAG: hypothetical protein AAGH19_06255 [Pseudomonadota bacterium]